MTQLRYDHRDDVAVLTLLNPPQNRLTTHFAAELSQALTQIEQSSARAVLLRAEGPDFSWGGDFLPWRTLKPRELQHQLQQYLNVFNRFETLPLPTIAAVQGRCLGGGLELILRADIVMAAESASFAHPEQTIAVTTLMGGIYRIAARIGRNRAMEFALLSDSYTAADAAELGFVNRVVADNNLQSEAHQLAQRIAQGPTLVHAAHKHLLHTWANHGVGAADDQVLQLSVPLFASHDTQRALQAAQQALQAGEPRSAVPFDGQ